MDNQYVLSFDGKDDYVSIPTMNVDYSQGFTVEAWVLYHSFPCWSRIIDFGNGLQIDNIIFANDALTGKLVIGIVVGGPAVESKILETEVLETGVWMHLAATIDKSGNTTLYKNGQVVKTGSVALPRNMNRTLNYIGKSNYPDNDNFHGCMTELRVWNIGRSAAEIQAYKNSRLNGDEKGLAQYWPLNEINGDTVVNLTSNGHDGTVHGATLVEAKPQLQLQPATPKPIENLEYALKFDGQEGIVSSADEMNTNFSQGFTVEAWVLYHSFPERATIIGFLNSIDSYQAFLLRNDQTTRKLAMETFQYEFYSGHTEQRRSSVISEEVLETGVWMHLAATVNSSNNVTLYKNGEVVKTGSLSYLPPVSGRWGHWHIGRGMGGPDNHFHGCITEARLWNIVRSVDDIRASKNRRLNGDEKGLVNYWPLNEISGNTVVNLTTKDHLGTILGGVTLVEAKPPVPLSPKTFLIKSKLNGLAVVGTPHSQVTTGAVDSQNPLQRWTITADGVIKNEAGFVLDYQGDTPPYYVVIAKRIQGTQGSPSQQWRIENGVIKNKHKADLVVDIAGSNPEPNTAILAAPGMGGLNQKWEIVSV